ncbi:flagellar biosynthetic protein FliO [Paratissierella segnis]|uniref:Flagellar biosynthetic protein FliO n=1 Tax=Paratissierella segnis TaxID=2763679 RepID=A0A926EU83_9FIRM|nr:flagellar biosynthetic protein FliO [Paratissierella segnis]MBC8588338.1 flagellar biosynthetic protein FliO [Paratissierella segnis]
MDLSSVLSIVKTIVVLLIIIAIANLSLKYLNRYMKKQNKIIKIIERVSVNNNSALTIVDICGKYYLMSFTSTENKILKELDKEEIQYIDEMEIQRSHTDPKGKLGNIFEMRKKSE